VSVSYNTIIAEVALKINAIAGAIPSTLQANYIVSPLTTTEVVSSIFPLASIRDAILDCEGRLAWAIADVRNHPFRQYFSEQTDTLLSPVTLPAVSNVPTPIVGVWGEVTADANGTICSEKSLDEVRRAARMISAGQSVVPIYWFNITGGKIEHTVTAGVRVTCCVYDRNAQLTELNANGNILLPDSLAQAYVCGAVATLVRDDEFTTQSQIYAEYFKNALDNIAKGLTSVDSAPQLEGVAA
jgi:hypothetical protein